MYNSDEKTEEMKKGLLCICFALTSMYGWAQDIMGKWITEAGDAQVEIYQQGDKVNGKNKTLRVLYLPDVHTLDADGLSAQLVGYLFSNSLTAVVHDDD